MKSMFDKMKMKKKKDQGVGARYIVFHNYVQTQTTKKTGSQINE